MPQGLRQRFDVVDALFVAKTANARVWRVKLGSGQVAALKHYPRGHMGNEIGGGIYLQRAGDLAVSILDQSADALLMSWCDGGSLGDWARAGHLRLADQALASIAQKLLAREMRSEGLTPLPELFSALIEPKFEAPDLQEAQALARHLLVQPLQLVALHGDLHFDNVLRGSGGWQVIDAKGLSAPRGFELANAFRHPRGRRDHILAPKVIAWRLGAWSRALGCSQMQLCQWAAIKTALSLVWRAEEQDRRLLNLLLQELRQ